MKLSLECAVESNTLIPEDIEINFGGRTYFFYRNEKGVLDRIKIVSAVNKPEECFSTVQPLPEDPGRNYWTLSLDNDLLESLIKEFHELESIMAMSLNLKSIAWDAPKYELIPETEEEAARVAMPRYQIEVTHRDTPEPTTKADLEEIIQTKQFYTPLMIPMSFHREAINEYRAKKYIMAFFNFYFIIEGLYGNGKTKNKDVAREFKNSQEFRGSVDDVIEGVIKKKAVYRDSLSALLKRKNKNLDVDGVVELIVEVRGSLHHFVNNPNIIHGTPFNHAEYQPLAYITMMLAQKAIVRKMLDLEAESGRFASTAGSGG